MSRPPSGPTPQTLALLPRVRALAQTATTQGEIGDALGCTHQYIDKLIRLMPDGADIRALIRGNRERWREQRRAASVPQPPERFTPPAGQIAEFRRVVALAARVRQNTPVGAEPWQARERRRDILAEWHERGVALREVAGYGGVSLHVVKVWHKQMIDAGRLTPRRAGRRRR